MVLLETGFVLVVISGRHPKYLSQSGQKGQRVHRFYWHGGADECLWGFGLRLLCGLTKQKAETSEQLRLGPAMHRNIVPAEEKLARPERAIGLLPSHKQIQKDSGQEPVQFWKTTFQQYGKV